MYKKEEWDTRGKCPLCGKNFKSESCPHSVVQAHERIAHNKLTAKINKIVDARIKKILRKDLLYPNG